LQYEKALVVLEKRAEKDAQEAQLDASKFNKLEDFFTEP
jgi:hypothetical protein